jgi:hypothetical protein
MLHVCPTAIFIRRTFQAGLPCVDNYSRLVLTQKSYERRIRYWIIDAAREIVRWHHEAALEEYSLIHDVGPSHIYPTSTPHYLALHYLALQRSRVKTL